MMKTANILTIILFILLLISIIFVDNSGIKFGLFLLLLGAIVFAPKFFKEDRSEDSKGFLEQLKK